MTLVGAAGGRMMTTGAAGPRVPRLPNQLSILPFPLHCKFAVILNDLPNTQYSNIHL